MSFGGPPPSTAPPSGPFEETISQLAGSPYTIAAAIFLLNIGGRYLSSEITRGQEEFLNTPLFRRFTIFVIFFVATRNIITAGWISLIVILCIGYLFNENSDLYLFGKATSSVPTVGDGLALSSEEMAILKSLQEKAAKVQEPVKPIVLEGESDGSDTHERYKKIIGKLWSAFY